MKISNPPILSGNEAVALFEKISPFLRIAHIFRPSRGYILRPRIIYDHLLLYTKEGTGWVGMGRKRYRLQPGTLFLVRPRVLHWQKPDPGVDLVQYNLHFDFVQQSNSILSPSWLNTPAETLKHPVKFRPDPTLTPSSYLPEKIRHFVPSAYETLFHDVVKWASLKGLTSQLRAKSAMIELLAQLYHFQKLGSNSQEAQRDLHRFDDLTSYLMDHLASPLTLDMLAQRCGMSRSHFSRRFKACHDLAPMKYLNQLRINRAKYHLAEGKPIKDIAESLGYATVHHFTRIFKQVSGMPPARYRRGQVDA